MPRKRGDVKPRASEAPETTNGFSTPDPPHGEATAGDEATSSRTTLPEDGERRRAREEARARAESSAERTEAGKARFKRASDLTCARF